MYLQKPRKTSYFEYSNRTFGFYVHGIKESKFGLEEVKWEVYPPYYTLEMDPAGELYPKNKKGDNYEFIWQLGLNGDNTGTVNINRYGKLGYMEFDTNIKAASPALALCLSAMLIRKKLEEEKVSTDNSVPPTF